MIKFPYGTADFYKIITQGYFYVDRTGCIPVIEKMGETLLFLRPRRFGKSLLLSMLENYYDVNKADAFEQLFGQLEIGRQSTPTHNTYLILKWNFSEISPQGDVEAIKQVLYNHLNDGLKNFAVRYRDILPFAIEFNPEDAVSSLASTLTSVQATPYKLYLLIDEYDNFANEVLMAERSGSQERYEALIQGEGMLKMVFKAIKSGTEGRGIDRVFITGVSPVVMSDMTSGFNIASDIYLEPELNDLCGFTEADFGPVLRRIIEQSGQSPDKTKEMLALLRLFYDGYRFNPLSEKDIYNSTLILYFLRHLQRHGTPPEEMLDENLAMDRVKIAYISQLPGGAELALNTLNDEQPLTATRLANRFGAREILYAAKDTRFMLSLLYYFGVLTLSGERNEYGDLMFRIPNLVVQSLYVERLFEMLLPTGAEMDAGRRAAQRLYQRGEMQPLCDFIAQHHFTVFDNRDLRWANELVIKTLFLTLLFNDTLYIMDSEPALQREYADFIMLVRPDMRQYKLLDILIEFKYVPLGANNLSGDQVQQMTSEALKTLAPVKNAVAEAKQKLTGYRQTLRDVYGERLRLHTFTVVAVGFDRLVWEELG